MEGVGPPLVTPFTQDGDIDEPALRDLVGWVEERGVDFIVPCGSNSEAELMTAAERAMVTEIVVEEASVPVLAGTGSPGRKETVDATEAAAEVGADAALVVTPFYYNHDQEALEAYYREVADAAPIPVYLYSVPAFTDVRIEPETVERLASHPNIAGMKDSSGNVAELVRTVHRTTEEAFDVLVGSGSVLAQALDAGATGGVVALANIAPDRTSEIYETHAADPEAARARNAELVELNRGITTTHGVPGLKWAMRERGAPAGHPRSPHRPVEEDQKEHLASLVDDI
ncbi:dihydrodipicolinate synthase family protein [Halanaeroarchaeum sp. HSR-CO]|uniref:dihydrodipicolinate synthase family protein n=1 Tax=Halanaeroarchaeum sp. HSR-CO TaxID=2866382 RepID=UPI00217DFAFE|nr:dihydrodipicolinate synthase family protein [Halanaeroarchaeum sp. HSR-CO]